MRCYTLRQGEIEKRLVEMKARLHAVGADNGRRTVRVRIEAEILMDSGHETIAIYSHRAGAFVYLGPFTPEITVTVESSLANDGGYDILSFTLLGSDTRKFCVWAGDLGFPFWGGAAVVAVRLLSRSVVNSDGVLQTYEVTIS